MLWRRSSCTARSRSNFSLVKFRRSLSTSPSSSTLRVLSDAISRPWLWLKVLKIFTWEKELSNIWNWFCNVIELKKTWEVYLHDQFFCEITIWNNLLQSPKVDSYTCTWKDGTSLNTNSLNSQGSKCLIFLIVFNILLAVSLPYGLTYVLYSKNSYHIFILHDFVLAFSKLMTTQLS